MNLPSSTVISRDPRSFGPELSRAPLLGKTIKTTVQDKTICHFTSLHTVVKARSFHRECMPLAKEGYAVRLVGPQPFQGPREGVEFVSVPMRRSFFLRMLLAPTLLLQLLRQNADLYHFQDPELLPLGLVLKLVFRRKVVYDCYEDFPSMIHNSSRIPSILRTPLALMLAGVEGLAAHCIDGLTTADPLTLRRFAKVGKTKKLVFFNFPNLEFFPEPQPGVKRFDIVYRGGLSERAGITLLLAALHLLARQGRQVRLLLIGYCDSSNSERFLHARIRSLGLESSVEVRGRIEHEMMAEALSEARIGVCPLQPIPKFLLNIPVKVFEYWACGLPVIASDLPPIRPFLRHGENGLLFKPGDVSELSSAIQRLLNCPAEAVRLGDRGRRAVLERYNNRNEIRKLSSFCEQILGQSNISASSRVS